MTIMYGVTIDLEVPYFACFRKPTSTSVMLTYPVPPFTTIVGMIANALGVSRPDYSEAILWLQQNLWLNLRPLSSLQRPSRELVKILKLVGEEQEVRHPRSFPSSPMYKYFLVRPAFRVFVASQNIDLAKKIAYNLQYPQRPLYLGQSDDMVTVRIIWQGEVTSCESEEAWALVEGIRETNEKKVEVLRLPLAFENERRLIYSPLLTLPPQFPFRLPKPEPMWRFAKETVHLFNACKSDASVGEKLEIT